MSRKILNGWKQISNHIERGVRTGALASKIRLPMRPLPILPAGPV
jgi:hypothetical protein